MLFYYKVWNHENVQRGLCESVVNTYTEEILNKAIGNPI